MLNNIFKLLQCVALAAILSSWIWMALNTEHPFRILALFVGTMLLGAVIASGDFVVVKVVDNDSGEK